MYRIGFGKNIHTVDTIVFMYIILFVLQSGRFWSHER